MTPKIKEKVLKGLDYEEYQDGLLYYRDSEGIRKSIAHINAFELLKAIDLTLAEVGKVIDEIEIDVDDGFHPIEKHCNSKELKQKLRIK